MHNGIERKGSQPMDIDLEESYPDYIDNVEDDHGGDIKVLPGVYAHGESGRSVSSSFPVADIKSNDAESEEVGAKFDPYFANWSKLMSERSDGAERRGPDKDMSNEHKNETQLGKIMGLIRKHIPRTPEESIQCAKHVHKDRWLAVNTLSYANCYIIDALSKAVHDGHTEVYGKFSPRMGKICGGMALLTSICLPPIKEAYVPTAKWGHNASINSQKQERTPILIICQEEPKVVDTVKELNKSWAYGAVLSNQSAYFCKRENNVALDISEPVGGRLNDIKEFEKKDKFLFHVTTTQSFNKPEYYDDEWIRMYRIIVIDECDQVLNDQSNKTITRLTNLRSWEDTKDLSNQDRTLIITLSGTDKHGNVQNKFLTNTLVCKHSTMVGNRINDPYFLDNNSRNLRKEHGDKNAGWGYKSHPMLLELIYEWESIGTMNVEKNKAIQEHLLFYGDLPEDYVGGGGRLTTMVRVDIHKQFLLEHLKYSREGGRYNMPKASAMVFIPDAKPNSSKLFPRVPTIDDQVAVNLLRLKSFCELLSDAIDNGFKPIVKLSTPFLAFTNKWNSNDLNENLKEVEKELKDTKRLNQELDLDALVRLLSKNAVLKKNHIADEFQQGKSNLFTHNELETLKKESKIFQKWMKKIRVELNPKAKSFVRPLAKKIREKVLFGLNGDQLENYKKLSHPLMSLCSKVFGRDGRSHFRTRKTDDWEGLFNEFSKHYACIVYAKRSLRRGCSLPHVCGVLLLVKSMDDAERKQVQMRPTTGERNVPERKGFQIMGVALENEEGKKTRDRLIKKILVDFFGGEKTDGFYPPTETIRFKQRRRYFDLMRTNLLQELDKLIQHCEHLEGKLCKIEELQKWIKDADAIETNIQNEICALDKKIKKENNSLTEKHEAKKLRRSLVNFESRQSCKKKRNFLKTWMNAQQKLSNAYESKSFDFKTLANVTSAEMFPKKLPNVTYEHFRARYESKCAEEGNKKLCDIANDIVMADEKHVAKCKNHENALRTFLNVSKIQQLELKPLLRSQADYIDRNHSEKKTLADESIKDMVKMLQHISFAMFVLNSAPSSSELSNLRKAFNRTCEFLGNEIRFPQWFFDINRKNTVFYDILIKTQKVIRNNLVQPEKEKKKWTQLGFDDPDKIDAQFNYLNGEEAVNQEAARQLMCGESEVCCLKADIKTYMEVLIEVEKIIPSLPDIKNDLKRCKTIFEYFEGLETLITQAKFDVEVETDVRMIRLEAHVAFDLCANISNRLEHIGQLRSSPLILSTLHPDTQIQTDIYSSIKSARVPKPSTGKKLHCKMQRNVHSPLPRPIPSPTPTPPQPPPPPPDEKLTLKCVYESKRVEKTLTMDRTEMEELEQEIHCRFDKNDIIRFVLKKQRLGEVYPGKFEVKLDEEVVSDTEVVVLFRESELYVKIATGTNVTSAWFKQDEGSYMPVKDDLLELSRIVNLKDENTGEWLNQRLDEDPLVTREERSQNTYLIVKMVVKDGKLWPAATRIYRRWETFQVCKTKRGRELKNVRVEKDNATIEDLLKESIKVLKPLGWDIPGVMYEIAELIVSQTGDGKNIKGRIFPVDQKLEFVQRDLKLRNNRHIWLRQVPNKDKCRILIYYKAKQQEQKLSSKIYTQPKNAHLRSVLKFVKADLFPNDNCHYDFVDDADVYVNLNIGIQKVVDDYACLTLKRRFGQSDPDPTFSCIFSVWKRPDSNTRPLTIEIKMSDSLEKRKSEIEKYANGKCDSNRTGWNFALKLGDKKKRVFFGDRPLKAFKWSDTVSTIHKHVLNLDPEMKDRNLTFKLWHDFVTSEIGITGKRLESHIFSAVSGLYTFNSSLLNKATSRRSLHNEGLIVIQNAYEFVEKMELCWELENFESFLDAKLRGKFSEEEIKEIKELYSREINDRKMLCTTSPNAPVPIFVQNNQSEVEINLAKTMKAAWDMLNVPKFTVDKLKKHYENETNSKGTFLISFSGMSRAQLVYITNEKRLSMEERKRKRKRNANTGNLCVNIAFKLSRKQLFNGFQHYLEHFKVLLLLQTKSMQSSPASVKSCESGDRLLVHKVLKRMWGSSLITEQTKTGKGNRAIALRLVNNDGKTTCDQLKKLEDAKNQYKEELVNALVINKGYAVDQGVKFVEKFRGSLEYEQKLQMKEIAKIIFKILATGDQVSIEDLTPKQLRDFVLVIVRLILQQGLEIDVGSFENGYHDDYVEVYEDEILFKQKFDRIKRRVNNRIVLPFKLLFFHEDIGGNDDLEYISTLQALQNAAYSPNGINRTVGEIKKEHKKLINKLCHDVKVQGVENENFKNASADDKCLALVNPPGVNIISELAEPEKLKQGWEAKFDLLVVQHGNGAIIDSGSKCKDDKETINMLERFIKNLRLNEWLSFEEIGRNMIEAIGLDAKCFSEEDLKRIYDDFNTFVLLVLQQLSEKHIERDEKLSSMDSRHEYDPASCSTKFTQQFKDDILAMKQASSEERPNRRQRTLHPILGDVMDIEGGEA